MSGELHVDEVSPEEYRDACRRLLLDAGGRHEFAACRLCGSLVWQRTWPDAEPCILVVGIGKECGRCRLVQDAHPELVGFILALLDWRARACVPSVVRPRRE